MNTTEMPEETHLDPDGLWIPPELREFDRQVVVRTPASTTVHFGPEEKRLDAYLGGIDEREFGPADGFRDPRNPDLAPDQVSIKPEGEEPVVLTVDVNPDVRCDGSTCTGGPDRDFGNLFDADREQLEDIFGEEWRDCITPYGANKLLSTLSEARAKRPDPIEDGDECPVCGDEIVNAHDAMEGFEGESLEAEKVCVVEFPNHSIVHFSDERIGSDVARESDRDV